MGVESGLAIATFKDRGVRANLDLVIGFQVGICNMRTLFAALEVGVRAII